MRLLILNDFISNGSHEKSNRSLSIITNDEITQKGQISNKKH